MRSGIVLCCLLLLAAASVAAAQQTILVIGDSLSAAHGLPVEQGWVALLQDRLKAEQYPYRIVNASIGGDTTASGRERLPAALNAYQPALVVLQLGGNDGLRGLSLVELKRNLAAMIKQAEVNGARVLLVGVQLPPNYGRAFTGRFEAVYKALADEYGVELVPSIVDGIGTRAELMQADGIHPNQAAQLPMAEKIWAKLGPLLAR